MSFVRNCLKRGSHMQSRACLHTTSKTFIFNNDVICIMPKIWKNLQFFEKNSFWPIFLLLFLMIFIMKMLMKCSIPFFIALFFPIFIATLLTIVKNTSNFFKTFSRNVKKEYFFFCQMLIVIHFPPKKIKKEGLG